MSKLSENNKRIAKNTMFLYFRMLLTMGVALFTSRVILQALGVSDFGIYNVVGGVVAMFGLVKGVMTGASARFINIALGRDDKPLAKKYFSISLTIYAGLCLIFVLLAETIGLWFVNTQLVIPSDRMIAANWVYQFSILVFINSLLSIPYTASIIAHEKMGVYAYVGIIEVVMKLAIVYVLYLFAFDRLILYGFLLLTSEVIVRMIYRVHCVRKYDECKYKWYKDWATYKEIITFSSWNIFGVTSSMIKSQGLNILLNVFFNPTVNAARGIAYQVNHAILQFSNNFYMSVRPQVTKYYARNEIKEMNKLVFRSSKMTLYLMLILSLPVLIETHYILSLWLGQVPDYAVDFVRYMIVISIIESMGYPIITAVQATGKIAKYQIVQGTLTALNIPISYILLKYFDCQANIVFQVSFIITTMVAIARVIILSKLITFPVKEYFYQVFFKGLSVGVLAAILPFCIHRTLESNIFSVIYTIAVLEISLMATIYFLGLQKDEKTFIKGTITNIKKKFK